MRLPVLLTMLCALAVSARAQRAPAHPYVLKAQRLFDVKSGQTISPGVVVVDGGKIVEAGKAVTAPPNAEVIELGDATLLPGLMDAHTHLSFEATNDWQRDELDGFKKPIPEVAIEATAYARRMIEAGFTTVRDLGSTELIDVGLRNAIAAGRVPGPRMLVAVNAIGARGGHCDPTAGYRPSLIREPGTTDGVANGPDEIRAAVRYDTKHGADVIKVCASGGVLSLADKVDSAQLTQAELAALTDEAHALGRRTAAHAHGAEAIKRAVRAGIDSIEHGTFADDAALQLMKSKGTWLVYTPTLCLAERMSRNGAPAVVVEKSRAADAQQDRMFQRALKLGVRLAFGTDSGVCPHGSQWEQMVHMGQLGMTPPAVLRAATLDDARLFGLDDRLGSLERGKLADVIAVQGDPLRDLRQMGAVIFVMKEGAVVKSPRR